MQPAYRANGKAKAVREFGDFQTPDALAYRATQTVHALGIRPRSIIEPTCGRGAFLIAAAKIFSGAEQTVGVEINQAYLSELQERLVADGLQSSVTGIHADFFTFDWAELLGRLPDPLLIIGNPPWVTNAELSRLNSVNLPEKSNFQKRAGLEALTGKSNFDISEWMLLQFLDWLQLRPGTIAILCKSAVARKVLSYAWKHDYPLIDARIYKIDAQEHFQASVDACFLVIQMGSGPESKTCAVYETLAHTTPTHRIGYRNGVVVADLALYEKWEHLHGADGIYVWRSGIKHDCARVMELAVEQQGLRNGNGVNVSLEEAYLYPMLKSSDIGNGRADDCRKYMLVTQRCLGEDTAHIEQDAPRTWRYLQQNAEALAKRSSSIYRNQPPFSIFGVGDYTFAPWKVAISAFYKTLRFVVVGPIGDRPVVFDDTVYFLPCWSEEEARFIAALLNSSPATEFLHSMIFWGDKRPITIELLKRLSLSAVARELGREEEYTHWVSSQAFRHFVILANE